VYKRLGKEIWAVYMQFGAEERHAMGKKMPWEEQNAARIQVQAPGLALSRRLDSIQAPGSSPSRRLHPIQAPGPASFRRLETRYQQSHF